MLQNEIIIISKSAYDFVDEKTGEHMEGTSFNYLVDDNGSYSIGKASLKKNNALALKEVPGAYKANYSIKMQGSKTNLKLDSVEFISKVKIEKEVK